MSIADKLTQIADNMQRVYDAGVASAGDTGASYDEGYEAGKQAEYDLWWNAHQNFGKRNNYSSGFMSAGWTDETFRPKYDMTPTQANYMFSECSIVDLEGTLKKCGVIIDFSKCTSMQYLMSNNAKIKYFPTVDLSSTSSFLNGFRYAAQLTKVKIIGSRSITDWSNSFTNCTNLTDLTIEAVINGAFNVGQSPYLTHESLLSILNALNDRSETTTLICTLGTINLEKLTDEEKAIATGKGWTLA